MASPGPAPCPEERTNFFRVCRIVLDHIPEVLRAIFKTEVKDRHGHTWDDTTTSGNWLLNNFPRLNSELRPEQLKSLKDGQTDQWDPTLLFHVLRSAALCLLLDEVPGATLHQNGTEVSLPAGGQVPTGVQRVAIDSGNKKKTEYGEIDNISPSQIVLKKKVSVKPIGAKIYFCTLKFDAVDRLRELRNVYFGHMSSASTPTADLDDLLSDVKQAYRDLSCPEADIQSLTEIRREPIMDEATFTEYQERLEHFHKQSQEYDERIQGYFIVSPDLCVRGLEDRVEGLELQHEASARQTESNTRAIGELQETLRHHVQGNPQVQQIMISRAETVNVYNHPPLAHSTDQPSISRSVIGSGAAIQSRGGGPNLPNSSTTPVLPLGSLEAPPMPTAPLASQNASAVEPAGRSGEADREWIQRLNPKYEYYENHRGRQSRFITYSNDIAKLVQEAIDRNPVANGFAIIVANPQSSEEGVRPLKGVYNDLLAMKSTFEELRYATFPVYDVTAEQIKLIVSAATHASTVYSPSRYVEEYRIAFVFAGHGGEEDVIQTRTGPVKLYDVTSPFQPGSAPQIGDYPKLFFIDACRGSSVDVGVEVPVSRGRHDRGQLVPPEGNYLLAFATLPNKKSLERNGGLWMQTLARCLREDRRSIAEVLHGVNKYAIQWFKDSGFPYIQQPIFSSTLSSTVSLKEEAERLNSRSPLAVEIEQEIYCGPNLEPFIPDYVQQQYTGPAAMGGANPSAPPSLCGYVDQGPLACPQQNILSSQPAATAIALPGVPFQPLPPPSAGLGFPGAYNTPVPSPGAGFHPPLVPTNSYRYSATMYQQRPATELKASTKRNYKSELYQYYQLKGLSKPDIQYKTREQRGYQSTVAAPGMGYVKGEKCRNKREAEQSAALCMLRKIAKYADNIQ